MPTASELPTDTTATANQMAELTIGEINGHSISRRKDAAAVTYVHLLLDQHEIICGNGSASESYHPGEETLDSFDAETRAEVLALMGGDSRAYGASARLSLKPFEMPALRLQSGLHI